MGLISSHFLRFLPINVAFVCIRSSADKSHKTEGPSACSDARLGHGSTKVDDKGNPFLPVAHSECHILFIEGGAIDGCVVIIHQCSNSGDMIA